MEKTKYIWLDGEWLEWDKAQVHVLTHSLHYGMAAFEGIRAYRTPNGPAIFRLHEHMRRLYDSMKIVGSKIPVPIEQASEACRETVRKNGLEECYIRPLAFVGEGTMGVLAPNNPIRLMIACWKWGAYLGTEGLSRGIRAKVSSFTRSHPNSAMNKAKITGNYVNSTLAKREAKECGFDEAIMLDPTGFVAEGTGENIFIYRDGSLITPTLPNVLEGITRDTVIALARDLGIPLKVRNFARDELYISEEAFFCGTAAEITPIREVDGRTIGNGAMGPITRDIQNAYFKLVRGEGTDRERNTRWLIGAR